MALCDTMKKVKEKEVCEMSMKYMMPLCNSSFEGGQAVTTILAMDDEDQRRIAWGEYCYFSGKPEEAVGAVSKYLDSEDEGKMLSAAMICTFAYMAMGKIDQARDTQAMIQKCNEIDIQEEAVRSCVSFATVLSSTLLHIEVEEIYPLWDNLRYLPEGLQGFAIYMKAHELYLKGSYEQAIGMIQTALAMQEKMHPIPFIYMMMVMCMCLMSLKRAEEADECFHRAWEMVQKDDLIEPVGEHHGLLLGLIEKNLKNQCPEYYDRIIKITYSFSAGWRRLHNPITGEDVADNLTTTEFTIGMMVSKGWRNKEIADYLEMSPNTVKKYLDSVFQKLQITGGRKEITEYMLK